MSTPPSAGAGHANASCVSPGVTVITGDCATDDATFNVDPLVATVAPAAFVAVTSTRYWRPACALSVVLLWLATACHVEPASVRPPPQFAGAVDEAAGLAGQRAAPVAPDHLGVDPVELAEGNGLGEVARRDLDLETASTQAGNDRLHDQYVRGIGQVDPGTHQASSSSTARATSSTWASEIVALMGSARWVRAASAVPGRTASAPCQHSIAGWRCTGTR